MDTYRTFNRYLRTDDVYAYEPVRSRLTRPRTPQINVESDQFQHMRRATPVSKPLHRTLMWVADLPQDVRPSALLRDYARIANVIAAAWGDRSCLHAYMESLFTDSRGNRRGFPPDVLSELQAIQRYYDTKDHACPWEGVRKRG